MLSSMTGVHPALQALLVALGAALGGLLRWQLGLWLAGSPAGIPGLVPGTWVANAAGGVCMGVLMQAWPGDSSAQMAVRLALGVGFLGGLTTYSTFAAESFDLLRQARWLAMALHTAAHWVGAVGGVALGWLACRGFMRLWA